MYFSRRNSVHKNQILKLYATKVDKNIIVKILTLVAESRPKFNFPKTRFFPDFSIILFILKIRKARK